MAIEVGLCHSSWFLGSGLHLVKNIEDSVELVTRVGKSCHTPWFDADLQKKIESSTFFGVFI